MRRPQLSRQHLAATVVGGYLLLALPATRSWLEASMVTHMLVQMPLLVALGALAAVCLDERRRQSLLALLGGPVSSIALATFASSYWMLPRALDAAIGGGLTEAMKFLSLPLLVGLPVALAWQRLGPIGRGFVWTNLISMLGFLGWLYLAAPVRVCNNYLLDEQSRVGWLLVNLAVLLFAGWLGTLFVRSQPAPGQREALPAWAAETS